MAGGGENADGDRQVEGRSLFAYVCRGEIDRNALEGKLEARIGDGGVDPLAAFLHRAMGKTHRREGRQSPHDVGLHLYDIRVDTQYRRRTYPRKHHRPQT